MDTKYNLPKTMKALVAYGSGEYRLETAYPVPDCGPNDLLIKTEGCGKCAGDLKCKHGAAMFWGDENQPAWVKPPFIPGHEFVGKIVAVGENVCDYVPGERIAVEQIAPCGQCRFCKTGHYWMCQPHQIYGFFNDLCGGMAEYVRIPTERSVIHRVPEDLEPVFINSCNHLFGLNRPMQRRNILSYVSMTAAFCLA